MDIDNPESFMRNLPSGKQMALDRLRRAGFEYNPKFDYDDDAEDDHDPEPEEGAWHKNVRSEAAWGYNGIIVTVQLQSRHRYQILLFDIQKRHIATYKANLDFGTAAAEAVDLVVRLERNELEIRGGKLYPVNETMKPTIRRRLNEKHDGDCTCGFCKQMRKNQGKGDIDPDSEKSDDKDEKKPTAESIVSSLLDT